MWINIDTNHVIKPTGSDIVIDGNSYPKQIVRDKAFMLSLGYKPYREVGVDSKYYWQGNLTKVDNGDEVVGTYEAIPRDIEALKETMLSDLEATANGKFQEATSEYTSAEMSSWTVLEAQAREHLVTPLTSGMLFDEATYSGITVDALASKVINNADAFKAMKSYISGTRASKAVEIKALSTLDAIKLYEATPYVYTYTQEDIDEMTSIDEDGNTILPLVQVGDTEDRIKNQVKEW